MKIKIKISNLKSSISHYSIFEKSRNGEINQSITCNIKWFLQYHYTKYFTLVSNSKSLKLSKPKTLINKILSNANLSTIFIEPHLKNSVHLNNSKIRLHGCRAVRYGDHIHF